MDEWAREAWNDELHRLRVRAEDKDVIRAYHWRGAPDEAAAEAAVRELAERAEADGFVVHWGRKVLEVRPPVALEQGPRRRAPARRHRHHRRASTWATTTPTSTRSRPCAGSCPRGASRSPCCVGVASDETPAELEAQADLLVDGPVGVRTLLSALAA